MCNTGHLKTHGIDHTGLLPLPPGIKGVHYQTGETISLRSAWAKCQGFKTNPLTKGLLQNSSSHLLFSSSTVRYFEVIKLSLIYSSEGMKGVGFTVLPRFPLDFGDLHAFISPVAGL